MSRGRLVAAVLAAALAPAASASAVTPSVVGWPVAAPAGELLPVPDGDGAVVNASWAMQQWYQGLFAYRGDLVRRWTRVVVRSQRFDEGPTVTRLNADGSYGPVGVMGREVWNVDARGRLAPACIGHVLADGSCIGAERRGGLVDPQDAIRYDLFRRTAAGADVWRLRAGDCCELLQAPVLDDAGTVYSGLGWGPGRRLMAVDPATGAIRWERDVHQWQQILTRLDRGVLLGGFGGVGAVDADGADVWSVAFPGLVAQRAIFDPARRRVVLQVSGGGGNLHVEERNAATGARIWARPGRLLGVGASGARYVTAPGDGVLRALSPSGGLRWTWGLARVTGVMEQRGGEVLVSTEDGLLQRLNPARPAPRVSASSVAISSRRTRVADLDAPGCVTGTGAVLRIRLAAASTVRVRWTIGYATPVAQTLKLTLPAGERHLPLSVAAGRSTIRVDWRQSGRLVVKRFAVTGVRCPA